MTREKDLLNTCESMTKRLADDVFELQVKIAIASAKQREADLKGKMDFSYKKDLTNTMLALCEEIKERTEGLEIMIDDW